MLKMEKMNGIIRTVTPYNRDFVSRVKTLHATWNASEKAWDVPEAAEQGLLSILKDIFGYDPASDTGETVTVQYNAEALRTVEGRRDYIAFGGIEIARRRFRDGDVTLHSSTFVVEGAFDRSGGSMGHPRIESCEGVILQTTMSKQTFDSLSEEIKEKMTIIAKKGNDRKKELEALREKLLKQLADVDIELEGLK